jgi:hypothetical protein
MALFWTMVVIAAIYLVVTMGSYLLLARKRSFKDASQVWAK